MKKVETDKKCCKKIKIKSQLGVVEQWTCNKPATYQNGSNFYCRKHSKMGRYVIRDGDVGEILFRCDTEKELRENIINFPNMRMQKITSSHRKDIF